MIQSTTGSKRFARVLALLLGLFVIRVVAQLVQRFSLIEWLPAFEAWHSGLLPFWVLLSAQFVIIAGFTAVVFRMMRGRMKPNPAVGALLLSLGAIYFATMLFRFIGALTLDVDGGSFSSKAIPAFFHLVLSLWLITLGIYHHRGGAGFEAATKVPSVEATLVHWLTYPVLVVLCLYLHLLLLQAGFKLQLSSYIPVAFGAVAVTLLERWFPHRREWQPSRADFASDLSFMVFVQILLPKVLAFLIAVSILRVLQHHEMVMRGLWPHSLHPAAQAVLMILVADFLRYWFHRASHEWSPLLWRFHAVHHSPQKLYWMNVGRFHPIEKSLQFLFDAAPFILVGVSESVLALYFVFYAVNGFFQHCNIEVRLGVLNFLISGPELHRWHHSQEVREANKNYGNNVILWDLLFGSYFFPKDRLVETLGLKNRSYPSAFLHQMRTPFIKGIDQQQE